MSLRILFVTPYYKPYLGGIERVIEKYSLYMQQEKDVEAVGVLTTHFAFPRTRVKELPDFEMIDGNVFLYRVPNFPNHAPPYFSVPLVYFPPQAIKNVIESFKPTIIHWVGDGWFWGHYYTAKFVPSSCAIIFSPSFHPLSWDKKLWLRQINRELCTKAAKITAITQYEEDLVKKAYAIPNNKLAILPWGVDKPQNIQSIKHPKITVLCIGRLGIHKNQLLLVKIWQKAHRYFTKPAQLVLIGKDEGDKGGRASLQKSIEQNNLQEEVHIMGEVTEAVREEWLNKSDIFILYSNYEAFGVAYFEAMLHGLPVLTHSTGPNKELLKKGTILTAYQDPEAAAKALIRLINDEPYRKKLSQEAQEYAEKFSWENSVKQSIRLYHEALIGLKG